MDMARVHVTVTDPPDKKLREMALRRLRPGIERITAELVDSITKKLEITDKVSKERIRKKLIRILRKEPKIEKIRRKLGKGPRASGVDAWRRPGRRKETETKSPTKHVDLVQYTRRLKRELITPWLEQLPYTDGIGVHLPEHGGYFKGDKLLIESIDLFKDFEYYVCHEPDPFQLLYSLERKGLEYWRKRQELLLDIKKLLEELEFSSFWPDRILDYALHWAAGERYPESHYLEFICVKPPRALPPLEIRARKNFLKNSITGERYQSMAREIIAVVEEIRKLIEDLKGVLKKHLDHTGPFLPEHRKSTLSE
jgi:hypothetical protein